MKLSTKKILITKSQEEAQDSLNLLISNGAEIIYFPTIKIKPIYNAKSISQLISNPYQYEYIIFTSANAVELFHKIITEFKIDLSRTKIAVIGKATAETCTSYGLYIHLIPEEYSSKGLIKKFSELDIYNKKILIPGSALSREDLKLGLSELGAVVDFIPIYDVVANDLSELKTEYEKISKEKPDVFIFTSPSSFENYLKLLDINEPQSYFENKIVCAIGPTTEFEIRSYEVVVNIVPAKYTLEGISEALIGYFSSTENMV